MERRSIEMRDADKATIRKIRVALACFAVGPLLLLAFYLTQNHLSWNMPWYEWAFSVFWLGICLVIFVSIVFVFFLVGRDSRQGVLTQVVGTVTKKEATADPATRAGEVLSYAFEVDGERFWNVGKKLYDQVKEGDEVEIELLPETKEILRIRTRAKAR